MKLIALASGRGSNFKAIVEAIKNGSLPNAEMVHLVCNKPNAPVLEIAKAYQVPFTVVEHNKLLNFLQSLTFDWVCLAGYMRILPPEIIRTYPGKILNIHPSLLPNFKGLHAQRQAIEAKAKESGCTVHLVTEGLDDGPILGQEKVEVSPEDTEETLTQKILEKEHSLYVNVLRSLKQ